MKSRGTERGGRIFLVASFAAKCSHFTTKDAKSARQGLWESIPRYDDD